MSESAVKPAPSASGLEITPPAGALQPKTCRVGNLVYTRAGLVSLFCWLIWFDFCFVLVEQSFTPILQFKMVNELGASAGFFIFIMSQVPSFMNFFMNPIISIQSDRHRGPRGRRIPYLLYATPFVCIFMAVMGFGNEISTFVHQRFFAYASPNTVALWTFGTLFTLFTFFNLFLNIVFYYLFNDVVPRQHIVKFMAYMRVVGGVAGLLYNGFIFGYSDKSGPLTIDLGFFAYHTDYIWYPKVILLGMSALFLVGFTVACMKIKEPDYPPPPPLAKGQTFAGRMGSTFKTLATECFTHKFYWLWFAVVTVEATSTILASLQNPMLKDAGVDPMRLAQINLWAGPVGIILTFLTAGFGDRWKPMPLMVVGQTLLVATAPFGLLFLIPGLSPDWYFWFRVAYTISHIPVNLVVAMAAQPLAMSLLPRDRFGQFSAAGNMIRAVLAQQLGAFVGGQFIDLMKWVHGGNYALRYCFAWQMFFQIVALVLYIMMFRMWKQLGGKDNYKPPMPATAKVTME